MAARDTCVAESLDTAHQEMDRACFAVTRYIQFCVITNNRRATCPGERACQPIHKMNLQWQYCDKGFSDREPHFVGRFIHRS